MNQKLELVIETTLDNRTYRLCLPYAAPFQDTFTVVDAFKVQLHDMERIAREQQEAQQKAAQEQATAS